jgi:integrase
MPLNDLKCRTAKPLTKPYKLFDGQGLFLEVMPSGSKFWRLKYRIHRREKRYTLGNYPSLGLSDARLEKENLKALIRSGSDPVLMRLQQKQTHRINQSETFEALAKDWYEINKAKWEPRYAKTIFYRLEKYAFNEIGDYPIHILNPQIVLACLKKVEITAPEMARRIKHLCSQIFMYGIAVGKLDQDYTISLAPALKKYSKGHFASLSVDELPEFLVCLNKYQSHITRQTYLAVKLMLLTFLRTRELVEAKWGEIDFEKALWIVPKERMKMKREHIVPLSRQSLEIITELKQMNGRREYIFPSIPRPRNPMSKGTILVALKRMGYKNRMTGHGFRSLALGVIKEKLGYAHEIADRQLAHAPKNSVDRAYDRAQFLPHRIEMMQKYADYISSLAGKYS